MADFVTIANKTYTYNSTGVLAGKTTVQFDIHFTSSEVSGSKISGATLDLIYQHDQVASASVTGIKFNYTDPVTDELVENQAVWSNIYKNLSTADTVSPNGKITLVADFNTANPIVATDGKIVTVKLYVTGDVTNAGFNVALQKDAEGGDNYLTLDDGTPLGAKQDLDGGEIAISLPSLADVVVDLMSSSDSGTLATDDITNVTMPAVTVNLTGKTLTEGHILKIVDTSNSSAVVGTYTITAQDVTNGLASKDITLSTLNGGEHTLRAQFSTSSGTPGTASTTETIIKVDTTAPTSLASVVVDLKSDSDSGSSTTDDITSAITPTVTVPLTGTALATGDIVRIIDTNNGNAVVGAHTVTPGITTQDITLGTLAAGVHELKAQLTDLAGNVGTVSTTATIVTVDTAAVSPTLALVTDNGSNTTDGITNVGTVNVTGLETGATWEYRASNSASWTPGTGNSFTLSGGTYASNNVQVRQTDAAGNISSTGMIATAITVDTTAPVFTSPDTGNINENNAVTTIIYTASATDNSTHLTYSLSGTDANLLSITADTGAVTLNNSADYESSQKSYSFTVSASDGANSADKAVVVAVIDVNEPHTGTATISGQPAIGATLTADISTLRDQDGLNYITYQWQANSVNIGGATGPSMVVDAEQNNLPITVKVTYSDGFGNTTVTSPEKLWNQPPVLSVTNATVSLAENAAAGEIGVQATATDIETDAVTLGLVSPVNSNNDPLFAMAPATGKISLTAAGAAALNYESNDKSYTLTVTASDAAHTGASATTRTVTVNITDVNEAPTAVALNNATTSIAEHTSTTPHLKVADIAVTDDAPGTNAVTLSGADANSFKVVGTALYLNAGETLNYETKPSYALTVNVADSTLTGSSAVTSNYTLAVTDVNEAPTAVVLNNAITSIAENTSTTTHIKVADIAITDDAPGTNPITHSGADANSFEVVGTALYLKAGETLNYEATRNSYAVTVNVSDSTVTGSLPVTTSYTLNVTNVNDLPTGLNIDGTLTEGQTVEAKGVADEDGFGSTFYYQWKAGSDVIAGATGNTLLLDSSQVGKAITVKVSYTDGHGTPESISTTTTANVAASFKGVALDGYLSNALVWVDTNSDGKLNWNDANNNSTWDQGETATESWTKTDASGQFSGLVGTGKIMMTANPVTNAATNPGGTPTRDISTGNPFTGSYSAPAGSTGSTVVNPLTTLVVAEMARSTSDASTAAASVKTALGLGNIQNLDLRYYDPLAETVKTGGNDASAIKVQSAATQVANIMDIATSVAEGASSTKTSAEIAHSVAASLMATANSGPLDVTNTTVINSAITHTVTGVNAAVVSAIADASAAVNLKISSISGGTTAETLIQIAAAQLVAQDTLAGQAKTAVQTTNTGAVTVSTGNINQAVTDKVGSVQTIIPNYLPTGDVTITGVATQGHTLTVSDNLADIDGIPTDAIHYQWLANSVAVAGATGLTYTLTSNEVGKQINVVASYTDEANHSNSKESSAATVLAQHTPTGSVTITGTVAEGQMLKVLNNIVDADGTGAISYQWYAGSDAISGATGDTWQVSNAQEGHAISVKASYTDGHGTAESVNSSAISYGTTLNEVTHITNTDPADALALQNLLAAHSALASNADVHAAIADYYTHLPIASDVVVRSVSFANPTGTVFNVTSSGHEVLVIDIPTNATLYLDNVDFAIITGENVTIQGGDGNNIVFAGPGHQDIVLGSGDDILHGGDGGDNIGSLAGKDQLYGDAGNDTLSGSTDKDTLYGGTGNDSLDGGEGTDTAVFSGNFGDYTITRLDETHFKIIDMKTSDGDDGTDIVTNVEHFQFAYGTYDQDHIITADPYAGGDHGFSHDATLIGLGGLGLVGLIAFL